MRVWLSAAELDTLISTAQTPHQQLAFLLGGQVGLRRSEITNITPDDIVEGPTGKHVRIWEDYAKRDHYREPPIPETMDAIATTLAFGQESNEPLVNVDRTTVYRWVQKAAETLQDETGDDGCAYVDVHDLRRTWGTVTARAVRQEPQSSASTRRSMAEGRDPVALLWWLICRSRYLGR